MKFTQEIKDLWVSNLESGKYKQGFWRLHTKEDNSHCCIGVLGEVHPDLTNNDTLKLEDDNSRCPYIFLEKELGEGMVNTIFTTNDRDSHTEGYERDYSNVIDIIKNLPVQI